MSREWPSEVSPEELSRLPLRAAVAFAARCARRARPRYKGAHGEVLDEAIRAGEDFARGTGHGAGAAVGAAEAAFLLANQAAASAYQAAAARAAGHVAKGAGVAEDPADPGPVGVGTCARLAARAAASALIPANHLSMARVFELRLRAERSDCDALVGLGLGHSPEAGHPIDPSEGGPLGPLWPEGLPRLD